MKTNPIAVLLVSALAATMLMAQEPASKPAPKASPRPAAAPEKPEARPQPARPGQLANVRIDVKITDERTGQAPQSKTLSLTVADRNDGYVRASANASGVGTIPLNVDASPVIEASHIRLGLTLLYGSVDAAATGEARQNSRRDFQQRLGLVLDDGKPLRVADSADPLGDRHISLEVTATILR